MDHQEIADIVRFGPRSPTGRRAIGTMDGSFIHIAVPDRVIEARATTTTSDAAATTSQNCGANPCEKPVSESTFTLPIVLGIAIPVIGAAIVFIILTRRHQKKMRLEDLNDRHASMDFGLGDVPRTGARKGPNAALTKEMSFGSEKPGGISRRQMSLDIDLQNTNPYLLPPTLQGSRESLQSLSRAIDTEDPYRPVAGYYAVDGQSIRSQSKMGSSIHTGSSGAPSRLHDQTSELLSNASRMSRSNPPNGFVPPPRQNSLPPRGQSLQSPVESLNKNQIPYQAEPPQTYIAELDDSQQVQRSGPPSNVYPGQLNPSTASMGQENNRNTAELQSSNNYLGNMISDREPTLPAPVPRMSPPGPLNTLPTNPRPARNESLASNGLDAGSDYGDGFMITPPSPPREQQRGQRYSMDVPPEQFAQAGLGAPGFDPKRLSMGFRPLPPNAVTEGDDPELRANRIRSFYKEYFDETKPAPQGQYIEDYDENYMGDATYYDPATNAFVLPYNEPITRRAMTPPPNMSNGPRFLPPRQRQGSMGAMSAGAPLRGPPQGRSNSPGPSRFGRPQPRSYSSASGRMGPPAQQKRMPPPEALNTLPTPSKLRDDTFAINPMDFAPPSTYKDRVAGRSESPMGERRPYSPAVQAFTPVKSAFDELAPMPSPHMFRNSGTFSSLDFAAPRKFRDDGGNASDAGSIRSNRSGISQMQNQAIRNGAYRVSKLPTDVVFTKDDISASLKPQWGMRPS